MKIFNINEIKQSININTDFESLINAQKNAFIDYSLGLYDVPVPMQFIFFEQGSDCHIKGGYRKNSKYFVVKIASSSKFGNNGDIFVFDTESCELKLILQDKGFLTTFRTAVAGVVVVDLVLREPKNIGIIGSGNLAKQLYELAKVKYPKANIIIYARNKAKALAIGNVICNCAEDLVEKCDVVFTTTCSVEPIIYKIPENKKTVIIGLGSDDEHKSEIAPKLFKNADMVIVDSKIQAAKFGDVARALKEGIITQNAFIEIGEAPQQKDFGNIKTIIADFSGIGAQDVAMAEFVLSRLAL